MAQPSVKFSTSGDRVNLSILELNEIHVCQKLSLLMTKLWEEISSVREEFQTFVEIFTHVKFSFPIKQ